MSLSPTAKQDVLGPAVVGCVLGAFASLGVVGFDSEYGSNTSSTWNIHSLMVIDGLVAFVTVAGGILLIFGGGPMLLRWLLSRRRGPDA